MKKKSIAERRFMAFTAGFTTMGCATFIMILKQSRRTAVPQFIGSQFLYALIFKVTPYSSVIL